VTEPTDEPDRVMPSLAACFEFHGRAVFSRNLTRCTVDIEVSSFARITALYWLARTGSGPRNLSGTVVLSGHSTYETP